MGEIGNKLVEGGREGERGRELREGESGGGREGGGKGGREVGERQAG